MFRIESRNKAGFSIFLQLQGIWNGEAGYSVCFIVCQSSGSYVLFQKHEEAFFLFIILLGFSVQRFQSWQIGRRCIRWHRLFIVIQNMVGKIMMYSKHVQQY